MNIFCMMAMVNIILVSHSLEYCLHNFPFQYHYRTNHALMLFHFLCQVSYFMHVIKINDELSSIMHNRAWNSR